MEVNLEIVHLSREMEFLSELNGYFINYDIHIVIEIENNLSGFFLKLLQLLLVI